MTTNDDKSRDCWKLEERDIMLLIEVLDGTIGLLGSGQQAITVATLRGIRAKLRGMIG